MATYLSNLEAAVGDWLKGLGLTVGGRRVGRNCVFYGDFEAPKTLDKLPLIEWDFVGHASEQGSRATQEHTITLAINVWAAGARNAANLRNVRDAAEAITAGFFSATFLDSYGILEQTVSIAVDPEPLVGAQPQSVGCAVEISFSASSANARS